MYEERVTLRLPGDLHSELARYAAGNGTRPPSSLNSTIIFVLRAGLAALRRAEQGQAENRPGQFVSELMIA
jgi:hypothetical protein